MKKLTVKEGARQLAEIRRIFQRLEDETELGFISVDGSTGVFLTTKGFLDLQRDSCAEVTFKKRTDCSDNPLRAQLMFEGMTFFTIITPEEIKKFREMGFEIKVEGAY